MKRSGSAVVVEVADGDPVAVTLVVSPGDARRRVASSNVPSPRLRNRRSRRRSGVRRDRRREGAALDDVDVEPAVAVVIEQADASRCRLGELAARRAAVVEDEAQAGGFGVIAERGRTDEPGGRRGRRARAFDSAAVPRRSPSIQLARVGPRSAASRKRSGRGGPSRATAPAAAGSSGRDRAARAHQPRASKPRPSDSASAASSAAWATGSGPSRVR